MWQLFADINVCFDQHCVSTPSAHTSLLFQLNNGTWNYFWEKWENIYQLEPPAGWSESDANISWVLLGAGSVPLLYLDTLISKQSEIIELLILFSLLDPVLRLLSPAMMLLRPAQYYQDTPAILSPACQQCQLLVTFICIDISLVMVSYVDMPATTPHTARIMDNFYALIYY